MPVFPMAVGHQGRTLKNCAGPVALCLSVKRYPNQKAMLQYLCFLNRLDLHIHEYLLKKNLTECASVFERDRRRHQECRPGEYLKLSSPSSSVEHMWPCRLVLLRCAAGGTKVKAFLLDWWVIFWEIYSLRPPSKYFKTAFSTPQVRTARHGNALLS